MLTCVVALLNRIEINSAPTLGSEFAKKLADARLNLVQYRRLQGWVNHIGIFQAIHPISKDSVEEQKGQQLALKLLVHFRHYTDDQSVLPLLAEAGRQQFPKSLEMTNEFVTMFRSLYIENVLAPLKSELQELKDSSGGGSSCGSSWRDGIADRAHSWIKCQ